VVEAIVDVIFCVSISLLLNSELVVDVIIDVIFCESISLLLNGELVSVYSRSSSAPGRLNTDEDEDSLLIDQDFQATILEVNITSKLFVYLFSYFKHV